MPAAAMAHSVFVATVAVLPTVAPAPEAKLCRLQHLQLRFRDQAVDLHRAFSPGIYEYTATLDYAMAAFSAEATAEEGCVADRVPNQAISIDPGRSHQLTVFAKSSAHPQEQAYTVRVSRLWGNETTLRWMRIEGGVLNPPFDPAVRSYAVRLTLGHDLIKVGYVLTDSSEKIRCSASEQAQLTSPRTVGAEEGTQAAPEAGEGWEPATSRPEGSQDSGNSWPVSNIQHLLHYQVFPIDVGNQRNLTFTIESADPMQATGGLYTLHVARAPCNDVTPFYDPWRKACVINCPARFYGNREAHRCSECNTNCAACESLSRCQLCVEATIHHTYIIQPDGSCLGVKSSFIDKYYWWCVSFAIFVGVLLLFGAALFCQFLCSCCCGSGESPYYRGYDSESDGDMESERLLKS